MMYRSTPDLRKVTVQIMRKGIDRQTERQG